MAIPAPLFVSVDAYRQGSRFTSRRRTGRSIRNAVLGSASSIINLASIYLLPASIAIAIQSWMLSTGHFRPGVLVKHTRDDDLDNVPFRWIRAAEVEVVHVRRVRAITALVLVAASLGSEVQIGRLFAHSSLSNGVTGRQQVLGDSVMRSPPGLVAAATLRLSDARAPKVKTAGSVESKLSANSYTSSVVLLHYSSRRESRQGYSQVTSNTRISKPSGVLSPWPSHNPAAPVRQGAPEGSDLASAEKYQAQGDGIFSPWPSRNPATPVKQAAPKTSNLAPAKNYQALRDYALRR